MWQVAVYRPGQHEQFRTARNDLALCRSADEQWRVGAEGPTPCGSLTLQFGPTGEAVVLISRGLDSWIEVCGNGAFDCSVPVQLPLPCIFRIGEAWFEVRPEARQPSEAGMAPLHPLAADGASRPASSARAAATGPDAGTVAKWLAAASALHRTAASSPEFFPTAARLALESTALDAVMVLQREGDQWQIVGSAVRQPEHGFSFNASIVDLLLDQPVVWRRTTQPLDGESAAADSIVVAPVRNDAGEVIAAVYGVRHDRGDNRRRGIRTLEARLIELLADAVAVGMARRQQEIESARQQVLLEQAFSPAVAEHLRRHPESLAGATRDVTMLFADLRGFTSLAEGLPPAVAYALLAAVMETLTQAIADHDGVVIDYFGDGVSALWNAPLDLPDHADRACAAAMQMLGALPGVSRLWQPLLPRPLELGIGLHAGQVQVGNAGTRQRLKYGPRGSHVNVASRVQAAAKHLDVALLATAAVRRRLSARFITLKVCTARLPGLEAPLELFTVFPSTDGARLQDEFDRYTAALDAFEDGDFDAAEQALTQLLDADPATPAVFLAQQTAALRHSALGRRSGDQFGLTPDAVIEILAK